MPNRRIAVRLNPSDPPSRRWPCLLAAALILLVGATLRFAYYGSFLQQPDEQITVEVVRHMRQSGDWDVNWIKANVSPDLKYDQYNFSSHLYATYFFYRGVKLVPGLDAWRGEREGFLVYRFLGAALATAALWLTLVLGRRIGGWSAGLGAMALAAAAPLLVQDAHYIRPEPFTTVLTLGAIVLCWPREALSPRRVLGGAFCLGLLVACKISMLLIAWLPLVPLIANGRRTASFRWGVGLGSLAALAAGFALGAPGALLHPEAFANGIRYLATQYAGQHPPHSHLGGAATGDMMLRYFAATLGWPTLAMGLLGAGVLVARRRWLELALVAGPFVLFAGYFATRSVFFERNLSHVLPLFLILAGGGVAWAIARAAERLRPLLAIAAFALLAVAPARTSVPLIAVEYAGHGGPLLQAFEQKIHDAHPGAEWKRDILLTPLPLDALATHFRSGGRPVLFRVTDFRDDYTAHNLAGLRTRFEAEEIAIYEGTFPNVPTCTLLTYHSPTQRYVLVKGAKKA